MPFYSSTGSNGKLEANAMKRVAAGAHLPTPWLLEHWKRPDDRVDYCLVRKKRTVYYYSQTYSSLRTISGRRICELRLGNES